MVKLFDEVECLDIIQKSEQNGKWERNNRLKKYSYFTTKLELDNQKVNLIKDYCKEYLNLDVETLSTGILKYVPNDFFAKHIDKVDNLKFNSDFIYNVNMRLNDNYVGGDFYLNDKLFNQEVGTLYSYTSNTYHEVTKVKSGIRYSVLFYIRERDLKRKITLV